MCSHYRTSNNGMYSLVFQGQVTALTLQLRVAPSGGPHQVVNNGDREDDDEGARYE